MPRLEGQFIPESAFAPKASEPSEPLDWSADETAALKTMAVEIAALRGKIESRASTPVEEMRFKTLVKAMKAMVDTKETRESGPEFRELVSRERKALKEFFGRNIDVPPLPDEITPELYREWEKMGLGLHYLPAVDMAPKSRDGAPAPITAPGWGKKPDNFFFDAIKKGGLAADAAKLTGEWILIDTRRKPQYANGAQKYDNDVLAPALATLRAGGSIADFSVKDSRFNISPDELEKPEVKAAFARLIGIQPGQVHLPREIEFNVLGNMFYKEWGETNSVEWFEDVYQGRHRLFGGGSDGGGLSNVFWYVAGDRGDNLGFRPSGRFSPKR